MSSQAQQAFHIVIVLAVMVGTVLLIDAMLFAAWAIRKGAVDSGVARPLFAPRWSLLDVWIAGQVIVCLMFGMAIVIMIPLVLLGVLDTGPASGGTLSSGMLYLLLLSLIPQNALLVAVPTLIINKKYHLSLREIGWRSLLPSPSDLRVGVPAGIGMMLLAFAVEAAVQWLAKTLLPSSWLRTLTDLTKQLGNETFITSVRTPGLLLLLLLGGGVLAPIGEEFFFRGFVYNCGKRRFGVVGGAILSAGLFALVHVGPLNVIAIFPIGLLLCFMYERTRSLWVPIIMHAINNSVAILLVYLFPSMAGR